ncbi:MAG: HEPN domain-containing protein [Candidatus Bathyarchaeales archaeon]
MSIAKAHLEKAVERLKVTEKLFRDGDYEDAVSRAYYAMYHAARAALSTVNVFPKTREGVVSEFGRKFVLAGIFPKELGRNLADAKAARETYEYSVTATVGKSEAEAILLNAQEFVNAMKKHLEK